MSATITSEEQLRSKLRAACRSSCIKMRNRIYTALDAHLKYYYYDYDPVLYNRTRQLLHSLVKERVEADADGCGYSASVYFDIGSLDYTVSRLKNGRIKRNSGTKKELAEKVMNLANEGYHGRYGLVGMDKEQASIWDTPMAEIKEIDVPLLKEYLQEAGIEVV